MDAYFGNGARPDTPTIDEFFSYAPSGGANGTTWMFDAIAKVRYARVLDSVATNPNMTSTPKEMVLFVPSSPRPLVPLFSFSR